VPFVETNAVIVLPLRASRTQRGAVPLPPDVCSDVAPLERRRWNASPLPVDTSMNAWAELADVELRIITPIFVQTFDPEIEATRAVIVASPARDR
jgi:hypothetical protein